MRTPQSHTARENPPSQSTLEERMPVQAKLAAAWTSFAQPSMISGSLESPPPLLDAVPVLGLLVWLRLPANSGRVLRASPTVVGETRSARGKRVPP